MEFLAIATLTIPTLLGIQKENWGVRLLLATHGVMVTMLTVLVSLSGSWCSPYKIRAQHLGPAFRAKDAAER